MSYPSHELSKLNVTKKYFETLVSDDISYKFYQGTSYVSSLKTRCQLFFKIGKTLNELNNFYPYVPVISLTRDQYIEKKKRAAYKAGVISVLGWGTIYSLGIKGIVLPVLREYGEFIKTHRLLRQYLYLLIVPYVCLSYNVNREFVNHTEHLWATHARRLNAKILQDPKDTRYPFNMLPISQIDVWQSYYCHTSDRERKQANEVNLYDAPDYEEKQLKIYDSAAKPEEEEEQE